ncbi:MAG: hypothetical protein KC492_31685, partial [Myxococcales bacterium]|nr:hypothetical protein [Myxococcales bacterium]
MASKETSLAAVSAIWVAGSWRAHVNGRGAELRWPLVAAALGVATYLWLWGVVREGPLGGLGSGTPGFLSADLWRFVPKLFAVGVGALLSPHAAPMQSCGWLATRPLSAMEWGCSLLMVLLVVAVVRRRDWSGLLLMGGAAATLAPTALLYNALWLGFDRYLYMPLMLLLLALAPHVVSFVDRADERARRLAAVGGWLLVLVACGATYTASTFYVDQPTWMTSGVSAEPENPTRYVMIARELFDNGHPAEARAALEFLPPPPWPRAVTFALLDLTLKLNSDELYESLLQRASVSEPDHPGVRLHQVHHALHDGDLQRALELVPDLGTTDACAELASHMRAAAPRFTGEERERLTTAFEALPCVHRTAPDPRP